MFFMDAFAPKMREKLPAHLRASVGDYSLRGLDDVGERGGIATFAISNPSHLPEILGTWSRMLKADPDM